MGVSFLPTTDEGLAAWGTNASAILTAGPVPLGITAAMATQFASLLASFTTKLAAATNPSTRGPASVLAKKEAKAAFVAYARLVVRQIQGTATVTDVQRQSLGITVRKTVIGPIPAPSTAPRIEATPKPGRIVELVLSDSAVTNKRARPKDARGATIFSAVGAVPNTIEGFKFEGSSNRTTVELQFDASLPTGTKVYITAFWYNPNALSGPAATPIEVELIAGGVVKNASSRPMKIAA